MNSRKQQSGKPAFTIIELLTVMSIIVILIGLLVPALNRVRRYALTVKQNAQFHSIEAALELYRNENEEYPDSNAVDDQGSPYCGAMKLAEAMMGVDLLGYHPQSMFRANRTNASGQVIYMPDIVDPPGVDESLKARQGTYLQAEKASAANIGDLYLQSTGSPPAPRVGSFNRYSSVLCDVYAKTRHAQTGVKLGMPVLYYRAEVAKNLHDANDVDNSIYDYRDNFDLIALGQPDNAGLIHRLAVNNGEQFYENTLNRQAISTGIDRPVRSDSFILISAGWDREYGTADDIMNFEWKFRD